MLSADYHMHESAFAQNKILSDYSDRFCYESEFKRDLKKKFYQYSQLFVMKMLLNQSKYTNLFILN